MRDAKRVSSVLKSPELSRSRESSTLVDPKRQEEREPMRQKGLMRICSNYKGVLLNRNCGLL